MTAVHVNRQSEPLGAGVALRGKSSAALLEGVILLLCDALAVGVTAIIMDRHTFGPVACAGFLFVTHFFNGTYRRPRLALSALADMKSTMIGSSGPLVLTGFATAFGLATPVTIRFAASLILAVGFGRAVAYRVLRVIRGRGLALRRAVVVGTGRVAQQLVAEFAYAPRRGLNIVKVVDHAVDLDATLREVGATVLIVSFSSESDESLAMTLRHVQTRPLEVFLVPRLYDFGSASGDMRAQDCGGIPLTWLNRRDWRVEQMLLKRVFDLVFAGIALVAAAPAMVGFALAVKCSSPGPILYRQTRVGTAGKEFEMLKFRSMRVSANTEFRQSGGGDPRVTTVGKFIRRFSLDELPQLWNVVRGEMSMVGPRPEQPFFVDQCSDTVPGYADRHRVKVGLTGWSQINGLRGSNTSLEERARLDNFYIENWSIWRDISIILRTASAAASGS